MEGDHPAYVEALAVKDGKILLVGTQAEAMGMIGERTAMNDLQGRTLLPGFTDPHSHYINALLFAGQAKLYAPPAGSGKDVPSIIAELQCFALERNVPKGAFIIGNGYDDTAMPDGRRLNRDDLDAAFPDNPVRVDHVSMHGTMLNSLALKHYGYDANTKTPEGGVIVRKPGTNEAWGLSMETAFQPIHEDVPVMTTEVEIESTKAAHRMYASFGITTAQEGLTHISQLQDMRRTGAGGTHSFDVVSFPFVPMVEKVLAEYPLATWGSYTDRVKIGGVYIGTGGTGGGVQTYSTIYRFGYMGGLSFTFGS
ncbi:MAG: amidohydrolase family protein [Flavobacteriales bacterium]|nr:amidohydrolase family protein [Flavobacteriales bacterium]